MLVIKNVKIYTSAGTVIEKGDILIHDKKILKVGSEIPVEKDTEVIDGSGMVAAPGFIDGHTHAGCKESLTGNDHDANEISSPINPDLDVYYGIDAESYAFDDARRNGVTSLCVLPGSATVIGGMCAILKTKKGTTAEMVLVRQNALKASLGGGPRSIFGKRGIAPVTMMGQVELLREAFQRASECESEDPGIKNLQRVLNHEIPLRVHVESHHILNVIRVAEEFNIPFVLEHAFGFRHFIDEIANAKNLRGVILGPTFYSSLPGIMEDTSIEQAMELMERGVTVGIMTDYFPETNFGTLLLQAGEIARKGAEIEKILEMLTIQPARILGIDHRTGSIEPGKDADIVIFDGIPLQDARAKVRYTFVDGEIVYKL